MEVQIVIWCMQMRVGAHTGLEVAAAFFDGFALWDRMI